MNGLQHVREDLLAWDVPPHESVWKSALRRRAAAMVVPRDVPAWTMAAAAGLSARARRGRRGPRPIRGSATQSAPVTMTSAAAQSVVAPRATNVSTVMPATLTPGDLERLKQSLLAEIRPPRSCRGADARRRRTTGKLLDAVIGDYGRMLAAKTKSDERIKTLETLVGELMQSQQGGR